MATSNFVPKRAGDRRLVTRAGSNGRRAEDRERAAWAAFLDGCQRAYLGALVAGRGPELVA